MDGKTERSRQFTVQLRRSHRQLFGYIFALLRNLEDTQDVFQQTSMVLWDRFDEFESGTNFTAWACRVAQFKVRDYLKCRRRYEAHLSEAFALRLADLQSAVSTQQIEARRVALAGCVEKLSPRQREILDRCYGGTEGVAKVAQQLGRSPHGIYNSLRRIREALFSCVERTLAREARA